MDSKQRWRRKARAYLAEAFGGKCTVCGYDKTIAALDYHHVDSAGKDRVLSIAMRDGYAWSKIVVEARKCTIVCCRCHREIHAGITELPKEYARFNEEYADVIRLKKKEFDACPICSKDKWVSYSFCSHECASKNFKRFDLSKEELENLVRSMPYTKIAALFNVSDNAVRKRCKQMNIEVGNRRGYWTKKRSQCERK